tara:strand:+ start:2362 stop:3018 length:657 start_codon:yes stop_codon:yes gene_type:complete
VISGMPTSAAKNDRSTDNLFALALGVAQIFFSMMNEWLATQLGYEKLAGVGVLGIVALVGCWMIYRVDRKDYNSLATLGGLTAVALALLFVMGPQSEAQEGESRPSSLKSVVGEVFLDRNRNGFRDGADESIQGVSVTLRDRFGLSINLESDSRGFVSFSIPSERSRIQIVACNVAQSHTLSLNERISQPPSSGGIDIPAIYKIDIGIEHNNLDGCLP